MRTTQRDLARFTLAHIIAGGINESDLRIGYEFPRRIQRHVFVTSTGLHACAGSFSTSVRWTLISTDHNVVVWLEWAFSDTYSDIASLSETLLSARSPFSPAMLSVHRFQQGSSQQKAYT